ncbi:uncharacterized protein [Aegilops tauschii subsp. strangulata]|uniref:uncharacterized protein isoform X2 n=1 Tax=Aegilops tauschii subsp. strangulata TaxID=200361 RepID=UPI003CC8CDB7
MAPVSRTWRPVRWEDYFAGSCRRGPLKMMAACKAQGQATRAYSCVAATAADPSFYAMSRRTSAFRPSRAHTAAAVRTPKAGVMEMSSDDEKDFIRCELCEDQRGLCDRNFLVDDRRFSIKLDETFEVDTRIPCHARIFVLDKIGFSTMETMEMILKVIGTSGSMCRRLQLYHYLISIQANMFGAW